MSSIKKIGHFFSQNKVVSFFIVFTICLVALFFKRDFVYKTMYSFASTHPFIDRVLFSKTEQKLSKHEYLKGTDLNFSVSGVEDNLFFTTSSYGDEFSDIFAGRGGFDFLAYNEFPPSPAVWAKQLKQVGIYPELNYRAYRIQQGDMIGEIAEKFALSQDTLISVNSIKQSRLIQIGDYLRIPSMTGILYTTKKTELLETVAKKYNISLEKTAFVNHLKQNAKLPSNTTIFLPDAVLDWVTRQEINGDLFIRPIKRRYYMSSGFGWRKSPFTGLRSFHNGVDMACPMYTSVYAALAGRVTTVGWSSVYGNYVVITHHSGYKTLYGHLSEIKTIKNRVVTTGNIIGRVGNTGMSTGPHLHFSVFKYGKAVNPMNLWK